MRPSEKRAMINQQADWGNDEYQTSYRCPHLSISLRDMIKSDGQWPQNFTSATLTSPLSNRLIYVMSSWLSPCTQQISFQVVSTTKLFFSPMTLYYLLEFPVLANGTTHFLRSKLSLIFSFSPPSVFNPRTSHEGSSSWHLFISSWPHSWTFVQAASISPIASSRSPRCFPSTVAHTQPKCPA